MGYCVRELKRNPLTGRCSSFPTRRSMRKFTVEVPEVFKREFELKYVSGRFRDPGWKKRIFRFDARLAAGFCAYQSMDGA